MELSKAADTLKELGHPTRLSVYRELVKAGHEGLPVGELQKRLEIPASTLSHHLSSLISVSLVRQERQGRTLFCHALYENLDALIAFLTEECCSGTDDCPTSAINQNNGEKNEG
ncbi:MULTISPECIES: ArsR/SmtB family transcription factor [Enterobacterales]|jgi:DNA-binding transcriptional ArsR family regulator|uniref:ArsR/SmtB family transcription factor n=1 Tax=Yersinia TaxID=629 RepID=UPI0005DCC488|nr:MULTISPECIES: metalloregulator ArsR/SmtB family transcription factor [Enterobacterales]QLR71790.1 helix-turn-helix transcriptional regulator [Citrobacter freundii]QLY50975.1 helix-turn-helix transcriptional regulator [Citrobacter freundii]QMR44901.1 helix-turn-helix transcriptional regulator [Citrobacter freundii]CQH45517.1 Helix-turn-helix domain [Yersinia frederiksenii]